MTEKIDRRKFIKKTISTFTGLGLAATIPFNLEKMLNKENSRSKSSQKEVVKVPVGRPEE